MNEQDNPSLHHGILWNMTPLSYLILILTLAAATTSLTHLYRLRREMKRLPIGQYLLFVWGIAIISFIHVGETLIYVVYGYEHLPAFFTPVMLGLHLVVGMIRIAVPFFLARFIFTLTDKPWQKRYTAIGIFFTFILFVMHVITFGDPVRFQWLRIWLIPIPRFFFSISIMTLASVMWFWRPRTESKRIQRTIGLLSLFIGSYAFLLLLIRILTRLSGFFFVTGSTFRILVALTFYLLHLFFARPVAENLIPQGQNTLATKYALSKREQEIIALIVSGKTNKEIADLLFLSTYTVRDHCSSIMCKIGVKNRTQLTALFREKIGLIQ